MGTALQYGDELIFTESIDVKAVGWGEPYQGKSGWEVFFLVKEPVMSGIKKIRLVFCYCYDEENTAVIYSFRDDRFTEPQIVLSLEDRRGQENNGRLLLNLESPVEKDSIEEQLKK